MAPLLERLLTSVTTGVVVCDHSTPDVPIVYVNELFERITGYPAEEVIGRNCRFLQGDGSSAQARRIMRETIERGESTMVTLLNYRRDGAPFWNEVRLAPLADQDGTAGRYYLGLISDVTARVDAEADLSHAEVLRSTVFDSLVEGVFVVDTTTAVSDINSSALRILGVTREDLARDDWWAGLQFRTPDGRPILLADSPGWTSYLRQQPITDVQMLVRRGDGVDRLISFNYQPLVDPASDRPQGLVVTLRDVTEHQRGEQERQHFAILVDMSDDLIGLTELDGTLRYLNPAGRRLVGVGPGDDVTELQWRDLVTADGWRSIMEVQMPAARRHGFWEGESTLRHVQTGEEIPVRVNSYIVRHPATRRAMAIATVQRDISEEKRYTADLIRSRERYETQFRSLPLPTYIWQRREGEFVLADWNLAAEQSATAVRAHVRGMPARERYSELPEVVSAIERCWSTRSLVTFEHSFRAGSDAPLTHAVVTCVWVPPDLVLLHELDITERVEFERQLVHVAEHDDVTDLHNRRYFEQRLDDALGQVDLAVLIVDLDHFKFVNDSLGHRAGDELLREVAATMGERLREDDVLARIGGDEFAVLLTACDAARAQSVAAHLLAAIRSSVTGVSVTASAGVAVFTADVQVDASEAVIAADIALYQAKQRGRDRLEFYAGQAGASLTWLDQIRRAIAEDRLVLHAQPIMSLVPRAGPDSYELLVRMVGDDGQLIAPSSFLPTAEEFGLIRDIDRWVIREGVAFAARGHRASINLSARSIADPGLPGLIGEAIAAAGARPEHLTFEFTETAAVSSVEDARTFTRALREMGATTALDDFGTGFATFVLLKHLPVDALKIDVEFVRGLATSPEDQRIVRAIVQIAGEGGMLTVAEGVENAGALALLREYEVDFAQGYHIARPGPLPSS